MKSHDKACQVAHLIDNVIIFLHQLYRAAKVVQSAGLNGTESGIYRCLCIDRREEVHIKVGRNTAG